jgi:3-oxoacyl-[acyl-carrier-protein] synthase-3
LVIGAERFQEWVDWQDRANCIIFADGAGAAVVGPADEPGIGPATQGSAGDLVDTIYLRDHKYIYQEGQAVFRWATTQIAPVAAQAVRLAGLELSDVDALVAHQANLRIVDAIGKKLQSEGARADLVTLCTPATPLPPRSRSRSTTCGPRARSPVATCCCWSASGQVCPMPVRW